VLVDPADPKDVMLDEGPQVTAVGGVPGAAVGAPVAAWTGYTAGAPGTQAGGPLSPDLVAMIGEALKHASDQFATGEPGAGSTSVTVNGQTFQVPGGGGQTIVISPTGEVLTGAAAAAAASAAAGAVGAAAGRASGQSPGAPPAPPAGPSPAPSVASIGVGSSAIQSAAGAANGRVSIESLTDTGTALGDMRLFSFELEVAPAGAMPYKLSHAALVPSAQVPRLIRGASFPAVIDANLPGGIGIFWDR
jgi:hypothetical protein